MPTTYVPINQPIGDGEDVIDTNRFTNIPETQNFDQFVTIDKIAEENRPLSVDSDREFLNSSTLPRGYMGPCKNIYHIKLYGHSYWMYCWFPTSLHGNSG